MSIIAFDDLKKNILQFFNSKAIGPAVIGVFGSYANQKATPQSDIDVCIALAEPLSSEAKIEYSTGLSLLLNKEVDLLDLNSCSGVILSEAFKNSVWLKKDTEIFARLLTRHLLDQADFQPLYERILSGKRKRFLKS